MRFSLNVIYWCVALALFGSAAYFTWNVVAFKARLNVSGGAVSVKSGDSVKVEKIVDGDELSVSRGSSQFIVRILGVVAYEATGSDELVMDTARQSVFYLERNLLGKEINLEFEKLEFDPSKRLLAYVRSGGEDAGAEMIRRGLCLVYTKYKFSRMEQYLKLETAAMKSGAGLWANPRLAERSLQLKFLWSSEKKD